MHTISTAREYQLDVLRIYFRMSEISQTHMLLLFRSEQFQEAAKVERKHSVSEGCGVKVQSELRAERFSTHGEVQIGYSPAFPQRSFDII